MRKPILSPGPRHPITITPHPGRVTVKVGDRTIADTRRALALDEAGCPPVRYVPRDDVEMSALEPSRSQTYCPYKGDASYFNIRTDDGVLTDAVWSYERPHDAMAEIAGYLAFYPDQVEITER